MPGQTQPGQTGTPAPVQGQVAPQGAGQTPVNPAPRQDPFQNITVPAPATPSDNPPTDNPENPSQAGDTPRLYAGRFKAVEELEQAYDASGREARRLFEQVKGFPDREKGHLSRIEQLEMEIKTLKSAGTFKELSESDLAKLRDENPGAYFDYMRQKDRMESSTKAEKEKAEALKREKDAEIDRVVKAVHEAHHEMMGDQKNFPEYGRLQGVMDNLVDLCPGIGGHDWTPRILYLASRGIQWNNSLGKAKSAEEASRQAAAGAAGAQAGLTVNPPPGGAAGGGKQMDPINAEIMKGAKVGALPSFG